MDWSNGDVLKRIIALLLALAGLAERAVGMPRPIRYVVLGILRRAEIAGRKVVAAEARDLRVAPWLPASAAVHGGNAPDDAIGLALCFRLLALALSNLSTLARRFAGQVNAPRTRRTGIAGERRWKAIPALTPHDTS